MQTKGKASGKKRMQEANSDTKFKKGQQDADFFKKLHKVRPPLPLAPHQPSATHCTTTITTQNNLPSVCMPDEGFCRC